MATRKFPRELLREIAWTEDPKPHAKVSDIITDTGRWSIHHNMIFRADDGLFYVTSYSVGTTENQDESPFEYSPEEVECSQVHEVEKTVKVW